MKVRILALLVLAAIALPLGAEEKMQTAVAQCERMANEIEWVKNYDEGLKLGKEERRPIFLDFWASW